MNEDSNALVVSHLIDRQRDIEQLRHGVTERDGMIADLREMLASAQQAANDGAVRERMAARLEAEAARRPDAAGMLQQAAQIVRDDTPLGPDIALGRNAAFVAQPPPD